MAWVTVPDVDNGASFGDSATNAYRNAIMELQVALDPVRRRDQRTTTTYAVGATDLIPTLTVESVGGITTAGGILTLPVDGVYVFAVLLNPSTAWGAGDFIGGAITRASTAFFLNRRELQNTTAANIESWAFFSYAGDEVHFTLELATGSTDVSWETEVALVSHVLP